MATGDGTSTELQQRTLLIERIFDAPRELVFSAWTDPKHMVHWWGPQGFASTVLTMDFRIGGSYRIHMRSPGNTDHWTQGIYREIVPPERLVMVGSWTDEHATQLHPKRRRP